jgi:hypothetical protein
MSAEGKEGIARASISMLTDAVCMMNLVQFSVSVGNIPSSSQYLSIAVMSAGA